MVKYSDIKLDHWNGAAFIAGNTISTASLHPLDLIKVRLQVNDGSTNRPVYKGWIDCGRQVYTVEGIHGLYKGVIPNIWGSVLSSGFYFFFYNNIKSWMQGGDNSVSLSAGKHVLAAAQSGVLTLTLTNPIWVAKTRMCLTYGKSTSTQPSKYSSLASTLSTVWREEGVRGLYRGFLPGIFGVSHGALQFMAYEELKKYNAKRNNTPVDARLSPVTYITFAALSKMYAVVCTYPYQVVRSRLQEQHRQYQGMGHVFLETWRAEGIKGFYKGLIPNLIRVTPACCITFVIYETMVTYLKPSPSVTT